MSKIVKLQENVYDQVTELMRPKETYSEVIERLLEVYETIYNVSQILGPGHYLKGDRSPGGKTAATVNR